jgi:hypothetical protein
MTKNTASEVSCSFVNTNKWLGPFGLRLLFKRRLSNQPNGTQPIATEPDATQINATKPNATESNGTQPNGIQHNVTQPNGT